MSCFLPSKVEISRRGKSIVAVKTEAFARKIGLRLRTIHIDQLFLLLISGIRCNQPSGVIYDEKCYFAPYISSSSNLNFEQAVQKCTNEGAAIAEIHSRSQQQALENFFRSKIPSSKSYMDLWIGTSYEISVRTSECQRILFHDHSDGTCTMS